MRTELNPCYLLHQRPYRETSQLLEIFSYEFGRVTLVGKGIRARNKTNKQAILQPCQRLMLSWSGRGELGNLNKMELEKITLKQMGRPLISAFYMNELIMRLLHQHEPHPELFEAYEQALVSLNDKDKEEIALRIFEKKILQAIGYGPVLDHEINANAPIDAAKIYCYLPERGPVESMGQKCDGITLHGSSLLAIKDESLNDSLELNEAKKLMRALINRIIGPKPLASRELYRSYLDVN